MIVPGKIKVLYPCKDGTMSTHQRRGACNWHGGLKEAQPKQVGRGRRCSGESDVDFVPLKDIHVAHEWFQNRQAAFSTRSVDNIVTAVQDKAFRWANMDAITLWKNPQDKKLYVLSGHSRFQAFRSLCRAGLKAEGRAFCAIPAKVASVDLATAKKMALESNTLATKETPTERAIFYRRQRQAGMPAAELATLAKRLEGRNANTILAFSYLNENGKTWAAIQALSKGQTDSKVIITSVGRYIGNARKTIAQLTNRHEDELYDWLITQKGYGSGRGQVNSEKKFKERLASIVNKRTTFGVLDDSLNIQSSIHRSPVEQQYNAQLEEAKKAVSDLDKEWKEKIRSLSAQGASDEDIERITAPVVRALRRARITYQGLIAKRADVQAAARNEQTLFGVNGTRKRRILII